jgi:iron complex outermembrane recepter protein
MRQRPAAAFDRPGQWLVLGTAWLLGFCTVSLGLAADLSRQIAFDIPAQPLAHALAEFSRQSDVIVVAASDITAGKLSKPINTTTTAERALKRLLEGSNLVYTQERDGSVIVKEATKAAQRSADPPAASNDSKPHRSDITTPSDSPQGEQTVPQATARSSQQQPELQEIVVTANRREESLSKVPISISAYTQEAMDLKGVRDFTDIARFTPGVSIDTDGTNSISIRGISSSGGAGTTGIYIDDTPIQMRAMGVNPDETLPKAFDMERVEILRGPQGTLFGAGSEGGTVRYIMTQPSLTQYSSYARSEVSYTEGGAPSYEAGAAFGGPIVEDTLGFRVSAWYRRDGGWIDRINPTTLQLADSNVNHDDTTALRAALTWAPGANVKVTPSVLWQDRKRNDVEYYWPLYSDSGSDRFVSANFSGLHEPDRYFLPALKVSAGLGSTELIANSSYYQRRDISGYDGTLYNMSYYQTLGWLPGAGGNAAGSSPYAGSAPCAPQGFSCYPLLDGNGVHLPAALASYRSPNTVTNQQDTVSQELRLQSSDPAARVAWTVGAFFSITRSYSLEEIHDPQVDQLFEYLYGTTIANVFGTATNPDGSSYLPRGDSYFNELTGHDRQLAGFGEAVWSLTDRLKLTTGLRYSKTEFSFLAYNDGPQNGGPGGGSGSQSQKPVTERVGLSFQMDPHDLFYATYSTGFRVGGANSSIPYSVCEPDFINFGLTGVPSSYKSDSVKNFEVGAKNNVDNRIQLAASVYYIKWDDIQQSVTLPTCGLSYVANLGTAVSEGGDLQVNVQATDALSLDAAIGYTDAHYTGGVLPGPLSTTPLAASGDSIVGLSGNPPAPWTIALGAQYRFRAFGDRDSFVRADVEHETKNNRPTAAEDPGTVQFGTCTSVSGAIGSCNITPPSTTFVSLRAGSNFAGWDVSAFVDNLLDTHPVLNYNYQPTDGSGPQPAASPLYRYFTYRPRTFGVTFTYRH